MHKAIAFITTITALGLILLSIDSEITGRAVYTPPTEKTWNDYAEYIAVVDGREFLYRYDGSWWESENHYDFERRVDMGESLYSGLLYLRGYHATIYHHGEEVVNLERHLWG